MSHIMKIKGNTTASFLITISLLLLLVIPGSAKLIVNALLQLLLTHKQTKCILTLHVKIH
jgi:hypothetical protein